MSLRGDNIIALDKQRLAQVVQPTLHFEVFIASGMCLLKLNRKTWSGHSKTHKPQPMHFL